MKLIALSQRTDYIKSYNETRDSLDHRLIQFIEECGYLVALVPNSTIHFQQWMSRINPDGIILSGGNNIGDFNSRDQIEISLIHYARLHQKPLLGICRGMQMLAKMCGTELIRVKNHVATRHQITGKINKESNSYHEFSIKECPLDFHVTSRASDGIIESIKHKSLPWEAIMWHPEREIKFQTDDKIRIQNLFK